MGEIAQVVEYHSKIVSRAKHLELCRISSVDESIVQSFRILLQPSPRSHRLFDERPIQVDLTAGINKAAADSLISLEPIFLMYCILNIWSDIHIDAVRIDLVALRLEAGGRGGLLIDSGGLKIPQPSYSSFNGDSSFPSKSISINSLRGRGWRRRWCWWGDGCRHC